MHNKISNQISAKLQYRKQNWKWLYSRIWRLSVTRKKNPITFNYTLHDHPLESLEQHKYLGHKSYKSLVTLWLEFACSACDPHNKGEINKLEIVQRRVLMFFTNRQRSTSSVGDILQHLNWRNLKGRGKDPRIVMMYKVASENVAITKHDRLNPPLRKSRNIHGVWCHRAWCQGKCQEMK